MVEKPFETPQLLGNTLPGGHVFCLQVPVLPKPVQGWTAC